MPNFPQIALISKPVNHQVTVMGILERALKARGYKTRTSFDLTPPEGVVFCWSWGKAATVRSKNPGAIICCIDHGYTRERGQFCNTGWSLPNMPCGLNGFAEHAWVEDGGERLRTKGWYAELRPFRTYGEKRALICGQVYGDAMVVGHVEDYTKWLHTIRDSLMAEGYTTAFRPHPVMVRRGNAKERYGNMGPESAAGDLWAALAKADLAVGLSSNAVTQAYVDGIDARIYSEGSMLSPLVAEYGHNVPREHRLEWFQRLAWCQWDPEEVGGEEWCRYHLPIMHRLREGGPCVPWNTRRIAT
jgi:hypothetical protein